MRISRRGESLVVETPAKLNLFLEVFGKRADGFHDLETIMVAVSLTDTLRFRPVAAGGIQFRQRFASLAENDAPPIPDDDRNLVIRAAKALAAETGCMVGVEIELLKRIPWQAGMGGGSSDAAATLVALNRLWDLGLTQADLHRIAAGLGSDLNFFVEQTPLALCRGRGETIEPRPLRRRLDFVVAQPVGGLSTAEVFRRCRPAGAGPGCESLLSWLSGEHGGSGAGYNALQAPAESLHPGLMQLCREMNGLGLRHVAMTGSGSACFGWCSTSRQAQLLARRMRRSQGCRAWAVHSIA